MKKLLLLLLLLVGVTAGSVHANGSPYSPGLAYGWPGVADADGVHYVTLGPSKWTVIAAVRGNGRVVRTHTVPGFYAVPLVAYNGVAGGLSGDGKSLVLSSYGPNPGQTGKTRLVVLNTKTLAPRRLITLDGSWSLDAVSPDAAALFLTEHLRAGDHPLYRIRAFDTRTGRLGSPIVDRLEGERDMTGAPVARAASAGGRWAYTLYARRGGHPFVHALDMVKREAFCIDLPLRLAYDRQWALRLRLAKGATLEVLNHRGATLAAVSLERMKVISVR